jgi:hypothetical protein
MQRTVLHNQSLLDVALLHFGTIEAVFDIGILNGKGIDEQILPGEILEMPLIDYGHSEVVNYYKYKNIVPATAVIQELSEIVDNDFLFPQVLPTL